MIKGTFKGTHTRKQGFSLIEIALPIGIIALALVPILGLLSVSSKQNFDSDTVAIGASIAGDLFSQVQQASFEQIEAWEATPPNSFYDNEGLRIEDDDANLASFTARTVIEPTEIDSVENPFMKRVTVWISAVSGDSTPRIDDALRNIESDPDTRLPSSIRTFQSLITKLDKTSN